VSHNLLGFAASFLGSGLVTPLFTVAFVLFDVLVARGVFAAVIARFSVALERHLY